MIQWFVNGLKETVMGLSILIGKIISIILETTISYNFKWIAYKVCQIWSFKPQVINYARKKAIKSI